MQNSLKLTLLMAGMATLLAGCNVPLIPGI